MPGDKVLKEGRRWEDGAGVQKQDQWGLVPLNTGWVGGDQDDGDVWFGPLRWDRKGEEDRGRKENRALPVDTLVLCPQGS